MYNSSYVELNNWQNESMDLEVWRAVTISGGQCSVQKGTKGVFLGASNCFVLNLGSGYTVVFNMGKLVKLSYFFCVPFVLQ